MTNHAPRPSPEEAQQALLAVSESRRALGPFVGSPAWLYPAQGLGMALFILGLVLFGTYPWAPVALGASVIVFCVLPLLQSTRTRVLVDVYTHRGSRTLGLLYLGAFTAIVAAALVLHALSGIDVIAYAAAVLAFVLTVIAGPAMEAKLAHWMETAR
ncbi:hypothetical protein [Paenarthrobacter aurescens]|uniref:hypothetical protein n=1 Tax=Paenarthrobacter aurescens TaxID=43663 RepID=UPI001143C2DD|nr:hypothetical protein [Paenarthrobacter aurescens]MDO6141808.1 hypothetical protein [Paenarthrobacter aurescens]MDO6149571.1 hypothetical protein [Paenarthrobacter aurescens]MDO6156857.1 hypothetical protein [Paenarthrobacter aurescens]MDO6160843.1 hypothetical protein [Paenarthrobacter aurescens]